MAGLNSALTGGQEMPAEAPAAPEQESNVSPEEQQAYEEIVARGLELIFEGDDESSAKVRPDVLKALKDENPREALGEVAGSIVFRVVQAGREAGVEIDDDMAEQAGAEIFEVLAEIATKRGIYDFQGDNKEFQAAWLLAVDKYRLLMQDDGGLDPDAQQGNMNELAAADQDGRLSQIMGQLGGEA